MLAPYDTLPLRALAFKVVIAPEPAPERAIAIVKEREDAFRVGRVLSMGEEAKKKIPELRVGDRVLYAQSGACTTAVRDRHIVHHEHVICAIDEDLDASRLEARIPA